MGILDKLFHKKENNKEQNEKEVVTNNWIELSTIDQIKDIKAKSEDNVIGIFKHSTRCVISRTVLKNFEQFYANNFPEVEMYYLDLLNYREISNQLEVEFQVMHQSPQMLFIKSGKAIADASHYDIMQLDFDKII